MWLQDLKKLNKRYRPEIEGLRIVAILLVVIYHFWLGRVSGGIDVFFVLTGFLITLSLVTKVEKNNLDIGKFWLGLMKRLFPQALVVMFVTIIVSAFILPQTQWVQTTQHLLASLLYFENWRLASEAVDYLAQGQQVSVFQHFWSLSVQGQIYIVWPMIIIIGYFIGTKVFKLPIRKATLTLLVMVFAASISYSIHETNTNQAWAYFDTFARLWEFSIGGFFALLLPYLKLSKWLCTVGGWLGIVIVCFTGIAVQVSTLFPGYMALLPISGALLILMASENSTKLGVDKFLSMKLFTFLGGLSYGIYLWHWPILRFYLQYFDVTEVPITHGCYMLLLTIGLSYLTTNLIEKPIRQLTKQQWKKSGVVACAVFCLAFIGVYSLFVQKIQLQSLSYEGEDYKGAAAIYAEVVTTKNVGYTPSLIDVASDIPSFYSLEECLVYDSPEVKKCSFGVTENPDYIVALVGGSHSGHWFPALEILAQEMNFQIDLYNHDGCRFTARDAEYKVTENCSQWNENLIEQLKLDPPDLVFTTSTLNKRDQVPEGYKKQWENLEGITTIFAIRDNPRMNEDIPTCLARESDPAKCGVKKADALSAIAPWDNTEGLPLNVIYGDLSDYFCTSDRCDAVIGNVIVYRDQHHITATYMETLAPVLKPLLQDALKQTQSF